MSESLHVKPNNPRLGCSKYRCRNAKGGMVTVTENGLVLLGSCHKRQKPQAPTPQAPIRNRQTRQVANAKGLNRNQT